MDKGITLLTEAWNKDQAGDHRQALELYELGIRYLLFAVKYEYQHSAQMGQLLRDKITYYLDRAEAIKTILKSEREEKRMLSAGGDTAEGSSDAAQQVKRMQSAIGKAILVEKPQVSWDQVAGLEGAKEALKEAVIMPSKFPHLFKGERKPWRGILLFGPPGTGKSHIAKAVASEAQDATFFSVSSSDLISKWVGESERMIKQLFEVARQNRPAIIFIDEVDSLCSARSDTDSDTSRRVKTEFLVQMQGVAGDNNGVLVMGATNTPWVLDAGMRRRFEKRIYIGLPDERARRAMIELHLGKTPSELSDEDLDFLTKRTEGYSGHDISVLVRQALLEPMRKVLRATHYKKIRSSCPIDHSTPAEDLLTPCSPQDPDAIPMNWQGIPSEKLYEAAVTRSDFMRSLERTKPTVCPDDLKRLEEFRTTLGEDG